MALGGSLPHKCMHTHCRLSAYKFEFMGEHMQIPCREGGEPPLAASGS